ncbi:MULTISPECIES: LysM peptidoglycan-binding domain-containing protein [unclassified Eikenella]|uniref:lytic transglycosylase n=1 Tax=unclassified Eikenella TaxID=2639367 RepID=UPI0008A2F31C|nr:MULTISPECIES: LysM peptidoglycan-binding domain-containing protein [unclassified Eikenella]OFK87057.1 lytic murein transglycosylase [Eikenella sp. HMSC071B05]OFO44797.1 lytic murein transglycosylase [Eikenella sp. HMSC073A11]
MSKFKFLSLAVLSLGIPASALAQTYTPEQIAASITNLNAAILRNPSSYHNNLWGRMRQDFRMSEVNPEIVRRHETYYSTRSAYFNRTVERSRPYLYHILSEVEKRNMPSEIALLPFIESAFVTKARSHVGASGLWQFMPATGRHYGLAQNNIYDGRHDIYASTNAALNYLQYLHNMFGDWSLALAAYNWGEGNVSRAVNRARSQGLEPVYENLNMPNETRNYVPKLLAVRNLVSNPQVFGLNLSNIENKPYFEAISINSPMDINAITRLANISQAEFEALNPSFKVPVFMPENGQRKLLLPVGAVNAFERNLRNAPKESLLSYDILRSDGATTLSDIADRNGVSVADLRRTNGLSSNTIRAGLPILVAKNSLNNSQLGRGVQMLADNKPAGDDPLGNLIRRNSQNIAERTSTVAAAKPATQPVATPPAPVQVASAQPTRPPEPVRAPVQQATNPAPAAFAALAANSPRPAEPAPRATSSPDIQVASAPTITQTAAQSVAQPVVSGNITTSADRLPETAELTDDSNLQPDPLMSLANNDSVANDTPPADEADNGNSAAAAVRASLAQTEAQETRRQAQAEARRANNAGFDQLASATGNNQRRAARQEQQANRRGAQTVTHKVQAGETLYSIARRYNVDVADLSRANNLRGNNIRSGQVLHVSASSNQQAANRHVDNKPNSRNERGNERNNRASNERNGRNGRQQTVSHTVRSGDTLQSIARRYNTSVADIKRSNNLSNSVLHPGQKLRVSSGT